MTRKLRGSSLDDDMGRRRILKPVVEKKRRDRINQSLRELRTLLLNYTSDVRLQNPKIEKAEILDLAVEYLRKWKDRQCISNDSSVDTSDQMNTLYAPTADLPHSSSQPTVSTLLTIETAGFRQCIAQLASYIHRIPPAQRMGLIQELKSYVDTQYQNNAGTDQLSPSLVPDFSLMVKDREMTSRPDTASEDKVICNSKEEPSRLAFVGHPSICQAGGATFYSMPCHDYLSPPPSPYLSCSPSAYTTPPPFPALACHFSFSPKLSPLSSNTSFSTPSMPVPILPAPVNFSPTLPFSSPPTFRFPLRTTLPRSIFPTSQEGPLDNNASSIWRPWF